MAIAQRTLGGQYSATSPNVFPLAANSRAGDYLLIAVAQQSNQMTPPCTDSLGTTIGQIGQAFSADGTVSICLCQGYLTKNGADTITAPTAGQSAAGAVEYSGVKSLPLGGHGGIPESSMEAGETGATDLVVQGTVNTVGDMLVAVIAAFGNVAITSVDPAWTVVRQTSGANVSFMYCTQVPSAPGTYTCEWTTPTPAAMVGACVGIQMA